MSLVVNEITSNLQATASLAKPAGSRRVKRAFDLCLAVPAVVFLMPALIMIAIGLLLIDGRPIIFRHTRIGQNGKPFNCFKFRTMRKDSAEVLARLLQSDPERAEEWRQTQKLKGDPRVHALGKYLRITSADELPQLFNVIRGDMSIVGPRPIISEEMERYGAYLPYYLSVKPGITGLWQVRRRAETTYEERVAMDVEYCDKRSLWMDLKIIWATIGVVLLAQNEA